MHVTQLDRVQVAVRPTGAILLECSACEERLQWDTNNKWWTCSCDIEVTVDEARQVLERVRALVDEAVTNMGGRSYRVRQGFFGWLQRLLKTVLGTRQRLPPVSKN